MPVIYVTAIWKDTAYCDQCDSRLDTYHVPVINVTAVWTYHVPVINVTAIWTDTTCL